MARTSRGMLRVLVVTPLGRDGKGGIDRVMDQLRRVAGDKSDPALRFVVSRGSYIVTSPFHLLLAIVQIVLWKRRRGVDVVHLNLSAGFSTWRKVVLAKVCNLMGLPYVIHLHSGRYREFWQNLSSRPRSLVDSLFRRAGAVIVLGGVWRDLVTGQLPDIAERVFIVPNATAARKRVRNSSDAPVILFLGRLGDGKGTFDLLNALAELPSDLDWRAVLAGDGAVSEARKRADELNLTNRVEVPGWVGPESVDRLLSRADILSLPSYVENLPMSVIEGMAVGVAIVTTPVGAIPDCIRDGDTGLLVDPGDVSGLAKALARLITDPDLRCRLGSNARKEHQRTLNLSNYVEKLEKPWRFAAGLDSEMRE